MGGWSFELPLVFPGRCDPVLALRICSGKPEGESTGQNSRKAASVADAGVTIMDAVNAMDSNSMTPHPFA